MKPRAIAMEVANEHPPKVASAVAPALPNRAITAMLSGVSAHSASGLQCITVHYSGLQWTAIAGNTLQVRPGNMDTC
jgi:hypothetical protein